MAIDRAAGTTARRTTPPDFARLKRQGDRIAMVTAYDAPSARLADAAGVDGVLVGDSAAMTVLGYESTVQITVDEMLVCLGINSLADAQAALACLQRNDVIIRAR